MVAKLWDRLVLWAWGRWHMRGYRRAHLFDVPDWYRRRELRRRFRNSPVAKCAHTNRRPNPEATAVLDRNPEVCLDCGTGIVHWKRPA